MDTECLHPTQSGHADAAFIEMPSASAPTPTLCQDWRSDAWDRDDELRILAHLALDCDRATVLLRHDVVGDRQSEAGAFTVGLVVKNG